MNKNKIIIKGLCLSIVTTVSMNQYALANDSTPSNDDKAQDTIVVTGQYTADEPVDSAVGLGLRDNEIPQSVSVMTEQRIQDQNLNNIKDVVDNSIGLSTIPADTERNTFISRGFEVSNYMVDSVPQPLGDLGGSIGQSIIDLSTYNRIEVVRGATGLMTGAGNPAAAINFSRKHADSSDFTGYVNVKTGSWDQRELSTDLSNGLNEEGTVRGRVVAKYHKNNSFMDRYSKETSVLYGVVDADITEDTLIRVGAGMQNNNAPGATWGGLNAFDSDGNKIDWSRSKSMAANWSYYNTDSTYYFTNLEHHLDNGWLFKADYNHTQYKQHSQLLYVGGIVDTSDEGASLGTYALKSRSENNIDSYDMQLNGDFQLLGQTHEFVTGLLYSEQTLKRYYGYGANGSAFGQSLYDYDGDYATTFANPSLTADYTTREFGFYAAARFHLTEDLKWIIGGRVSNWNRDGFGTSDYGKDGKVTPYTGLLYDITPQHRAYVSYAEIFSPQDKYDANDNLVSPLEGHNYEVGLKSALLDNTLHTTIALFRTEQDNYAEATGRYTSSGNYIYEEKDMTSKGFELEATGQITEGLKISAGYTQYKAHDTNGDDVSTTYPKKQFKVFTTYNFVSLLPELTVGGGVNWQSKIYQDDTSGNRTEQSNYAVVNLMSRYDITKKTNIQLNINNLFDKTYYSSVYADGYNYGDPMNFTLSVQHNF